MSLSEAPISRVLNAFAIRGLTVKGTGIRKWQAQCSAHDDQQASLSLTETEDGRVLIHCHARCSHDTILSSLNLTRRDLFPGKYADKESSRARRLSRRDKGERSTIVAAYDYTDCGELIYQSVRYDPKTFKQRRPDGRGGWFWNLDGVKRVLYRREALLKTVAIGGHINVFEGEKDVDNAISIGLEGTCNVGGACKWLDTYNADFKNAPVVIVVDNDLAGREHAVMVAAALLPVAGSVRLLFLPDLPEKGDFTDWKAARKAEGKTSDEIRNQFKQLARAMPEVTPESLSAFSEAVAEERRQYEALKKPSVEDVPETPKAETQGFRILQVGQFLAEVGDPPPMLIEGLLPDNSLVLLSGKPKFGKSLVAIDIGETIASGGMVWDSRQVNRTGAVVYLGMEDGKYEISNRLRSHNLNVDSKIPFYVSEQRITLGDLENVAFLRRLLEPIAPVLLIVDTAREALGIKDYSDAAELSEKLRPLRDFSRDVCTVLLVSHNRKADAVDAVDEIAGSNGMTSAVDGWISARRKTEEIGEDGRKRRRLYLDIDGRGGMRGEVVVEMNPDDLHFTEISTEMLSGERTEREQEDRSNRLAERLAPILQYLQSTTDGATVKEIATACRMNERTVRALLKDGEREGYLTCFGERKDGDRGRPAPLFHFVNFGISAKPHRGSVTNSENNNSHLDDDEDEGFTDA